MDFPRIHGRQCSVIGDSVARSDDSPGAMHMQNQPSLRVIPQLVKSKSRLYSRHKANRLLDKRHFILAI